MLDFGCKNFWPLPYTTGKVREEALDRSIYFTYTLPRKSLVRYVIFMTHNSNTHIDGHNFSVYPPIGVLIFHVHIKAFKPSQIDL